MLLHILQFTNNLKMEPNRAQENTVIESYMIQVAFHISREKMTDTVYDVRTIN